MVDILLEVELVPKTSHFKNLRSDLKTSEWDLLRKDSYKQANYCCEICGEKGSKWPVECHEKWHYENGVQTLLGLVSLCPSCHETVHIGFAQINGRFNQALDHLMKVNTWDNDTAMAHINEAFVLWNERSKRSWTLDISWANEKLQELRK